MSEKTTPNSTKVVTGVVRFSYVNVFTPKAIEPGAPEKYSVSLLIPKSDAETLTKIKGVIDLLKEQAKVKYGGKLPANFKLPLRDGDVDREDDEAYAGHCFINANATTRPGVVDKKYNKIIDSEEFYSGCYGHASVNFYLYDKSGSKGIACGLNNLMKTKEGEFLGGKSSPEADFAGFGESGNDDSMFD